MNGRTRLLCAVALVALSPLAPLAKGQEIVPSGHRAAGMQIQRMADSYGPASRLKQRIAADTTTAQTRPLAPRSAEAEKPRRPAEIIKEALPATVLIEGKTEDGKEFAGSGFLINASGTIVTNLHVIRGLVTIRVALTNGDVYDRVTVRAYDERRDIAVIQVLAFGLPVLRLGDSDRVEQGDSVVLLGNPLGLQGSASTGIVSAIRQLDGFRVFQTDAAASPGNSGGPMLNERGEVVGILTFRFKAGESLNFVVPVNYARGLLLLDESLSLHQLAARLPSSTSGTPATASTSRPDKAANGGRPALAVWLFGESGNPFEGFCKITNGTETESRNLAGVLPAKFTFPATALDCEFRKQTSSGLLLVQFVRDGRSIKDSLTRSPFGVVSLSSK